MPNLNDAFDWAFRRAMSACEDRRLDPPEEPRMMDCRWCEGSGFLHNDPCAMCDQTGQIPDDNL